MEWLCYVIFFILCMTGSFAVCMWYRCQVRKELNHLNNMLDRAFLDEVSETIYDESMLSALEVKLHQYLSMRALSKKSLIEEKEKIKGLISDISHQSKTPLSNILLYAQLLEELPIEAPGKEYIRQINAQGENLKFLMASLIKISRLETGIIHIKAEKNQISELLMAVKNQIMPKAKEKNISLQVKEAIGTALFDMRWTIEALFNILDNGVKYTKAGGTLLVTATRYEMFYRIDIIDNGIGMEEKEINQIFRRFYRSPQVNTLEGVGVGLYLTRKIITSQRGYIKVSSKLTKGSTFSVFLPI